MSSVIRFVMAVPVLGIAGFCFYGILASPEAPSAAASAWLQVLYTSGGLASLVVAGGLVARVGSTHPTVEGSATH